MTPFDDRLTASIARARRHALGDVLWRSAARTPDKTALIYRDLRQSYAELDAAVNRTANALAGRGVAKATGSRCCPTTTTPTSSPVSPWPGSARSPSR
jgi:non-ribosomal peptide synthetase component E (peptide arylation enzyme)